MNPKEYERQYFLLDKLKSIADVTEFIISLERDYKYGSNTEQLISQARRKLKDIISIRAEDWANNSISKNKTLPKQKQQTKQNNTMNKYYILSLVDQTIKTVSVIFGSDTRYTYLTRLDLKVGDVVVVPVGEEGAQLFKTASVVELHSIPNIPENSDTEYKFIVDKVSFDRYKKETKKVDAAVKKFDEVRRAAHRKQALAALNLGEDEIKSIVDYDFELIDVETSSSNQDDN